MRSCYDSARGKDAFDNPARRLLRYRRFQRLPKLEFFDFPYPKQGDGLQIYRRANELHAG
jgi:hypothetical protein